MAIKNITVLNAKDFSSRDNLETKVRSLVALTPDTKVDYQISGTRDELARLRLSDRCLFYGILCVITDTPTVIPKQSDKEKPVRGEIKKFGINGNLKEIAN